MVRSYRCSVGTQRIPGGVVHALPSDLRAALVTNTTALDAWKDITPLARNEFICWVEDAKKQATRERRIRRTQEELEEGQRRPCCWPGGGHRGEEVVDVVVLGVEVAARKRVVIPRRQLANEFGRQLRRGPGRVVTERVR